MSRLTDRVSFLRGMAAGMKLNPEKDTNRLIIEILNVLGEAAEEIERLDEESHDLSDYVECIDEDLAALEGDEPDEAPDDFEGAAPWEEEGSITYVCPHCGTEVELPVADLDIDEDMRCPACGEALFPEDEDGEADEDEAPAEAADEPEADENAENPENNEEN